jgi:diguanylate cyclase (GGDEF)-like protein
MIDIDIKTILLIYSISNIMIAFVMYFVWTQNRSRVKGISNWVISFSVQAVGITLIFMRGFLPDFLSVVVSNSLAILGCVYFYFGVAVFLNENIKKNLYYVIAGGFFVFQTYFGLIEPSLQIRIIVYLFIRAFITFQCARLFYKSSDVRMKINYRFTGRIMCFYVLLYLSRIGYYLFKSAGLKFFNSDYITSLMIVITQTTRILIIYSVLMMVNKKLIIQLEDDSLEREKLLENFRYLASVDGLTKLWNRETIEGKLKEEFFRSQRYNSKISLILLDIDKFKNINDTFGHPTGDLVLSKISDILKNNLRKTDFIGRWGGEEFMIVCVETDERSVWEVSEKLRISVERYDFGLDIPVTISLGNATLNQDESLDSILKRVDVNMYKAKGRGRNKSEPNRYHKEKFIEVQNVNYELCDLEM